MSDVIPRYCHVAEYGELVTTFEIAASRGLHPAHRVVRRSQQKMFKKRPVPEASGRISADASIGALPALTQWWQRRIYAGHGGTSGCARRFHGEFQREEKRSNRG